MVGIHGDDEGHWTAATMAKRTRPVNPGTRRPLRLSIFGFSNPPGLGKLRPMTLPRIAATILLSACAVLPLHASGKKGQETGISFHLQADQTDNEKMIFPQDTIGQRLVYKRVPELITKDVAGFAPFPSRDGEGYGAVLQLKSNAKNRWSAVTSTSVNRWVVARVNGRIVDAVMIDKQIDDGVVVIWKGIGDAEIAAFDQVVPRIGETKPRGKK